MKAISDNLKKIIIYVAIGLGLFMVLASILVPKYNYPVYVDNVGNAISEYQMFDKNIDVYFIGASHMQHGVNPMQLYSDYGIVSYNISTPSQPFSLTEYLVQDIFDNGNNPKTIVIDAGALFKNDSEDYAYRYFVDNKWILERIDLINHVLYPEIQAEDTGIIKKINIYEEWVLPFLAHHNKWEELNIDDFRGIFHNRKYFLQGYFLSPWIQAAWSNIESNNIVGNLVYENQKYEYYATFTEGDSNFESCIVSGMQCGAEVDEIQKERVKRIVELCKKNNCKVLMTKIPVNIPASDYISSWTQKRHDAVKEICDEVGIDFLDLSLDEQIVIDWHKDTWDGGKHLNFFGAEKVTDYLGWYLNHQYYVGNKRFKEYDEKLKTYDNYLKVARLELETSFQDYLDRLFDEKERIICLVSARDDMISGLSDDEIKKLRRLGLNAPFDNTMYRYSYLAVIDGGDVKQEALSNQQLQYNISIDHDAFHIISSGYLSGNKSIIMINNEDFSLNNRGVNIVVFDKESGLVIDRSSCDTWEPKHDVVHDVGNMLFDYQEYLLGRK